ncbi:MAG: DegT/DnrJ/EryC1/StrS family aminotransferase [Clostridiales bacterium]|nr:DegT/DnrJ/EryC1/StrS family aminotransferase [Clostridiales bacterium]
MDNQKIPFMDLSRQNLIFKDEFISDITEIIKTNGYINGFYTKKLEEALSSYFHNYYSVCVDSGSAGLFLALRALGIHDGDEVILPTNTFISTAWAILQNNACPIFVDCDPNDFTIQHQLIEDKITPKTKAIIGVHLYGQPFHIDEVKAICKRHHLYLIEDCAQAFGAKYKGRKVGTLGDVGCFSFYPSKNLGAFGDGGAIVTKHATLAHEICKLRNQGSKEKYIHDVIGYNYRLDCLQAAIILRKLKFVDEWNARRNSIAHEYIMRIKNDKIKLPTWSFNHIYHLFVILADNRQKLIEHLNRHKIGWEIHYPICCHLQTPCKNSNYGEDDFECGEYLFEHCISLPMYPELTDEEINRVIHVVNLY